MKQEFKNCALSKADMTYHYQKTKTLETNMDSDCEEINSIMYSQGQPLKYLIGFEQETRSYSRELRTLQPLEGLEEQDQKGHC